MTIKFSADPGLLTSLFKVLVASTKKWKSLAQVWRRLVEVTPQLLCDYPSQASLVCPNGAAVVLAIARANLPIRSGARFEGNSSLDRTRKRRAAVSDGHPKLTLEVFEAQVVQEDVA
jgi:hypothetical protein